MRAPLLPVFLVACTKAVSGTDPSSDAAVDALASVDVAPAVDSGAPIDNGPRLDAPVAQTCTPGAQVACACVGGAVGAQVCAGDGRSLGPCACPDAGTSAPADVNTSSCSPPIASGGRVPYYECTSVNVCPGGRFANSATRPGYRFTYLRITAPAALASAAILNTINPTLRTGTFLWGLQFDLTSGTFRTGGLNPMFTRGATGLGLMTGRFAFFNNDGPAGMTSRYNPIGGTVTVSAGRAASATVTTTVNIPIFADEAGTMLLTQLPLDNARFSNVTLTADRGCIGLGRPSGGRYTESTSPWATEDDTDLPYGVLDADITVANASMVSVTIGGNPTPLCNIISGANCMTDPQAGWARQPDSMVNGAPAYHLRANFAAISANIAP